MKRCVVNVRKKNSAGMDIEEWKDGRNSPIWVNIWLPPEMKYTLIEEKGAPNDGTIYPAHYGLGTKEAKAFHWRIRHVTKNQIAIRYNPLNTEVVAK